MSIIEEEFDDECKCHHCGDEVDDLEPLNLTVFSKQRDTSEPKDMLFCSWHCVMEHLPTIPCDYFISLPYLLYDRDGKDSAKEFMRILGK
jgi:hypothetical protein